MFPRGDYHQAMIVLNFAAYHQCVTVSFSDNGPWTDLLSGWTPIIQDYGYPLKLDPIGDMCFSGDDVCLITQRQGENIMGWNSVLYQDARPKMKAGDVIAFSGKGNFSEIIKWATRAGVSHVGVILQSNLLIAGDSQPGMFNQIIESTSLNGFSGVSISRLSDRLDTYGGEIWWLPLSRSIWEAMDKKKFYNFLIHQERKEYDMPQAIKSALDILDNVPVLGRSTKNIEDFSRFFCSELVAAGLEAAGGDFKHQRI